MTREARLQFIYQFQPADRPELATDLGAWTPEDEQIGRQHFEYLREAAEGGVVILAGRSSGGAGPAIVILEAETEEAARRFMEADPFLTRGLFRAELHPFRVALMRGPAS